MRTKNLLIKLSEEEKKRLLDESDKTGLSMTTLVRIRIADIIRPEEEEQ